MIRLWLAGLAAAACLLANADDWTPPGVSADAPRVASVKGKPVKKRPYAHLPKTGCASKRGLFHDDHFAEPGALAGCGAAGAPSALDRVLRGGAPTEEGLKCLKELGVTTVIDLRGRGEGTQAQEERQAAALGLTYYNFPMNAAGGISGVTGCGLVRASDIKANSDSAAAADAAISSGIAASPSGKVYVHCMHGDDRTGLTLGLRRRKDDRCPKDLVREEMASYWYTPFCALDKVWRAAP